MDPAQPLPPLPIRLAPTNPATHRAAVAGVIAAVILFTPIEEMTLAAIIWNLSKPQRRRR